MDNGQISTGMSCESLLWKEVGCRKDNTISVGRTKRSVEDAANKKARRSTDCITARAGRKSEARCQTNKEIGNKEQSKNIKERLGVAKRTHDASKE